MKTLLRRLVGLLAVACFVWVLRPFVSEIGALSARVDLPRLVFATVLGGCLYALSGLLIVEPWRRLVAIFGRPITLRQAWWCYGRSQWAKYLPSNAMHYVGRQLLGRQLRVSQTSLAVASGLEMGSLLCAALLVAVVFGRNSRWSEQLPLPWPALLVALLAALTLWPLAARVLAKRRLPLPGWLAQALASSPHQPATLSWQRNLRAMMAVLPAHVLFFVAVASLVSVVYVLAWRPAVSSVEPSQLLLALLWVVPTSWAAGTLALGAPAGMGVREAVFLLGLQPLIGEADAAGLALGFRCITVLGDAVMAATAWRLDEISPALASGTAEAPASPQEPP